MATTPTDYALSYHNLLVDDPRQGLRETVEIRRYQAGPKPETTTEYSLLKSALAKAIKFKGKLPSIFTFPAGDVIDPAEAFYKMGIKRAFNGKASPTEMRDVLRLAYRVGRIGKGTPYMTLNSYALSFLGQDCNAFVGNYYGVSPAVKIGIWATGAAGVESWTHEKQAKSGFGEAELLTLPYLPLKPRMSAREAKNGDVLVTLTDAGKFKHIAVIDTVSPIDDTRAKWRVVEWGEGGDRSVHIKEVKERDVVDGPSKSFGVGVVSKGSFRYLFAGPRLPEPATWGRFGRESI